MSKLFHLHPHFLSLLFLNCPRKVVAALWYEGGLCSGKRAAAGNERLKMVSLGTAPGNVVSFAKDSEATAAASNFPSFSVCLYVYCVVAACWCGLILSHKHGYSSSSFSNVRFLCVTCSQIGNLDLRAGGLLLRGCGRRLCRGLSNGLRSLAFLGMLMI